MGSLKLDEHIRPAGRFFAAIVACPFAFGFISAWMTTLGFFLFLLGAPVLLGCFVVGGLVFTVRGIRSARQSGPASKRVAAASAVPVMIIATAALAWPALAVGGYVGDLTRLLLNQRRYEAIIANARLRKQASDGASTIKQDAGVEYIVDAGPPVRVAFNPEGFLDNWSGIIFDPTGKVTLADGFNPVTGKFAAPDQVTKLFGGDLVECRHLWSAYYQCSFT